MANEALIIFILGCAYVIFASAVGAARKAWRTPEKLTKMPHYQTQ